MTMLFEWLISNAITASVLALIALAVSKAWPRRPALAHACWLLVLVKLLTPPIYVFPLSLPAAAQVAEAKRSEPTPLPLAQTKPSQDGTPEQEFWEQFALEYDYITEKPTLPDPVVDAQPASGESVPASAVNIQEPGLMTAWTSWLYDLWQTWGDYGVLVLQVLAMLGTGYLIVITLVRAIRFEKLLRHAQPASGELQQMTRKMGNDLGLRQSPSVLIVPGKVGPLLWHRWTKPVIVLPSGLLENMNGQELQTVLAHELTHYRRGDHLWRYLELAAVACYWWLPSAWWASRLLRQAEEECCDAGVVASLPDGVASYATALVRSLTYVAEPSSPCPALSSGLGPVTLLKRRLIMLHTKVERRLGVRGWLLFAAVAALALPIGISIADDDPPTASARREGGRQGERRERAVEQDDVAPLSSRAAAAPIAPRSPQGTPAVPSVPGRPPVGVAFTTPPAQATAPSAPSPFGSFPGNSDEMRATAEDAVRTAELDLKLRRSKVRAAENALRVYERESKRLKPMISNGAASQADLDLSLARLDQASTDLESAQIGVEQGELAVEQAKRRLSMQSRRSQPTLPPSVTTPVPSGPGAAGLPGLPAPDSSSGGRGGNRLPPLGGAASGGSVSGTLSGGSLPTEERIRSMFDNMDKDKTGRIPKEHFPGFWRDRFDDFDKNHDGFVTFEEFKANVNNQRPRAGVAAGGLGGSGGGGGSFGPGGGFGGGGLGGSAGGFGVSGGFGGGGAGFGAAAPAGGPPADPFFRNFDKQNTGRIRKDDVPEWMRERFFEMLDTNRDGVVDQQEFAANYNKLWETPSSRRGGLATARDGARGEAGGRGEPGRPGRGEAGGRGEGVAAGGAVNRTRPAGDRDPRDNRIEQLEQELREMRKALDGLKGKEGGAKP